MNFFLCPIKIFSVVLCKNVSWSTRVWAQFCIIAANWLQSLSSSCDDASGIPFWSMWSCTRKWMAVGDFDSHVHSCFPVCQVLKKKLWMAFHRARTHAFSNPMNGKWAARSLRIFSGWAARKFVDHSGRRRASSGSSSNLVATSKWPARAWHTFSGDNHCRWNKGPLKKGQDKGPAISSPRMLFVTVIKPC